MATKKETAPEAVAVVTEIKEEVPAQVAPERAAPTETVQVHEVHVTTDKVITDPNDPLAVQIPDAGRGDASLPIHDLAGQSPEQVFAS